MPQPAAEQRVESALVRFRQLYGAGRVRVLRAPARLNILGEHVDYVSYLPTASLPFGSHEHAMLMLWRARDDGQVRGASINAAFAPFAFALQDGAQKGRSWEEWLTAQPPPAAHWSNYVKGACFFTQWQQGCALTSGFDFLIDSTIPPRGGSSSSSALTVLAGAALRHANQIAFDHAALAQASARAEWYCGTRGGALDHTAICLAERGQAVLLDHATGGTALVPLPSEGYRWVTCFSHEADKGNGVMLAYNERAAVARLLIPALLAEQPSLDALPPAITLAEFARCQPRAFAECERLFPALVRERRDMPLKLFDRARHHQGEARRVRAAVGLLRATDLMPDATMRRLGALLNATHESLRDLYEVSTSEVESLRNVLLTDPQVYGARLMGGGFGGVVLALTAEENVAALIERVQHDWYAPRGRDGVGEGSIMVSTPGAGLKELQ